jgi:NTF2 fold immunity protein
MRLVLLFYISVAAWPMHPQPAAAKPARQEQHSYRPERGFVPDEATAVAIAEAVWLPIYGKETLDKERPFKAILNGDVWTVTGTAKLVNKQEKGGTAVAEIYRIDGRIIRVSHGM